MSTAKRRRESNWKQRKQYPHPHGKIKSLEEYAAEIGTVTAPSASAESSNEKPF